MIWWSNINWYVEQIMKVSYYEFYYEVVIIEEFSIRNTIWQHINDSEQIDQIHNVYFI